MFLVLLVLTTFMDGFNKQLWRVSLKLASPDLVTPNVRLNIHRVAPFTRTYSVCA